MSHQINRIDLNDAFFVAILSVIIIINERLQMRDRSLKKKILVLFLSIYIQFLIVYDYVFFFYFVDEL